MSFAGGIIGLPFSLEGFAFFLEAIFLGIYLYGWNRLSPRLHWLAGFPVAISAVPTAEMTAARLKDAGIPVVVIPGPASAYMGAGSASLVKVPESRVADARMLLQPEA